MSETLPYMAIAVSALTLIVMVAEKIWGGGNALAAKFHKLDKETTAAIALVRNECMTKIEEYEKVPALGFEAARANIHAMQLGLLEFRAKTSEDLHLYIRKDDYNAGVGDVKREMQAGFTRVDERLGELQDLIMYANPDLPNRVLSRKRVEAG